MGLHSKLYQVIGAAMGLFSMGQAEHLLEGREDLDIYFNKHVDRVISMMEDQDVLSLVYIIHSEITHDANGQDWGLLDQMFLKVLEELKGGYV